MPAARSLARQPSVKLITPNDAQSVAAWQGHGEAPAGEVQMRFGRVHMRHFADVEPQALQKHLGIGNQSAGAELWTRVVPLLKD